MSVTQKMVNAEIKPENDMLTYPAISASEKL